MRREVGGCGECRLDGDYVVAGEVCDTGDCRIYISMPVLYCSIFGVSYHAPASPDVEIDAIGRRGSSGRRPLGELDRLQVSGLFKLQTLQLCSNICQDAV